MKNKKKFLNYVLLFLVIFSGFFANAEKIWAESENDSVVSATKIYGLMPSDNEDGCGKGSSLSSSDRFGGAIPPRDTLTINPLPELPTSEPTITAKIDPLAVKMEWSHRARDALPDPGYLNSAAVYFYDFKVVSVTATDIVISFKTKNTGILLDKVGLIVSVDGLCYQIYDPLTGGLSKSSFLGSTFSLAKYQLAVSAGKSYKIQPFAHAGSGTTYYGSKTIVSAPKDGSKDFDTQLPKIINPKITVSGNGAELSFRIDQSTTPIKAARVGMELYDANKNKIGSGLDDVSYTGNFAASYRTLKYYGTLNPGDYYMRGYEIVDGQTQWTDFLSFTIKEGQSTEDKVADFLADSRWKDGASWSSSKKPILNPSHNSKGCCGAVDDFTYYVFKQFNNQGSAQNWSLENLRQYDSVYIERIDDGSKSPHHIVILEILDNGKLKTFDASGSNGRTYVSSTRWSIRDGKLILTQVDRSGSTFEQTWKFVYSHHHPK